MGSLAEKYRPQTWAEVIGQPRAVDSLRQIGARGGYGGRAYFITGASGTGKTTLARIIAAEVADRFCTEELDGSKLTADKVREIERNMQIYGWGKGGRAWIINECHGMRADTMRQLLTLLEPDGGGLRPHVCIIFTTTSDGADQLFEDNIDASPLLSRCTVVALARRDLAEVFAVRAQEIAKAEGLDGAPLERYKRLAKDCKNNMRMMLSHIELGELARVQ